MKTRIPPPIYLVAAAAGMKLLDRYGFGLGIDIPLSTPIAISLAAFAVLIVISAILLFRRVRTTIDPLNPDAASSLVQDGIFRITRNPMYLGMAIVLVAGAVYLQSVSGLIVTALFVLVLTEMQIKPEEQALRQLFGSEYTDYCNKVRRWI